MKALVLGAEGQLGRELLSSGGVPPMECIPAGRGELDITDLGALLDFVQARQPQLLINCAAFTSVDDAELNPDLALAVNATGAGNVAKAAAQVGARVIHISTDYVFDGSAQTPYSTEAEARPLGAYGHSKLAGEMRLQSLLPLDSVVVRTARLYSRFGHNFVNTMLRLMREREELAVVSDQVGSPTWARGLAQVIRALVGAPEIHGICHWTDRGQCSWYQFAAEIHRLGRELGLLQGELVLHPVGSADYPQAATRPAYSVLDCRRSEQLLQRSALPWQRQLRAMLQDLSEHAG